MRLTSLFLALPLPLLLLCAGQAAAQAELCADSTQRSQARIDACRSEVRHHRKSAGAHLALGRALHASSQMDSAIAEYRRAVELDARDSRAHLWLGRALSALDRDTAALEQFQLAIRTDSRNLQAHAEFVWLLDYLGRPAERDSALAHMRSLMRNDADAYQILGDLLSALDSLDGALAAYQTALRLEPKNPGAFESLAKFYARQEHLDSAEQVLLREVSTLPHDARSHRALGSFLYNTEKYERAAAQYDTVSQLDPEDAISQRWQGDALRALGRYREALDAYRAALARDSSSAGGYYDYALGLAAAGDTAGADEAFHASLTRDSLNALYHGGYGELLFSEQKWDAAGEQYAKAAALDSTERSYQINLILSRFGAGREAEGVRLSDEMVAAHPQDATAHLQRAGLMLRIGRADEAASSAREAIRLDSTLVDAYLQLALAHMVKEDAPAADEALSRGLAIDSTAAGLWGMRGVLYSVLGDHDTAMLYWQRALDIQPQFFDYVPQWKEYYETSRKAAIEATLPPGMPPG